MRHAAKKYSWVPGVYDLEPQTFEKQLEHWGDLMLNSDAVVCRFADASPTDLAFIRPIEDSKVFAGRLIEPEELADWQNKVCNLHEDDGSTLTADSLIQVCSPKKIYAEYRYWIVDQRVVTFSQYKRGDRVIYSNQVDQHVHNFVEQVLRTKNQKTDITLTTEHNGWRPHDAWCLDVCETPDGMRIVEINTINAAGFYHANMTDLVLAIERLEA